MSSPRVLDYRGHHHESWTIVGIKQEDALGALLWNGFHESWTIVAGELGTPWALRASVGADRNLKDDRAWRWGGTLDIDPKSILWCRT